MSERIAQFLANLNWRKITFPEGEHSLLLSDDPLIRTNGLATPEGHVAFPLTPRVAMVGVYDKEFYRRILSQRSRAVIRTMNAQAVESARHFVVDVDERQIRFIQNRFGKNHRPTISEQSLRAKQI